MADALAFRKRLPPGPAICPACKTPFDRRSSGAGMFRLYCSDECRLRSAPSRKRWEPETRRCKKCRKDFEAFHPRQTVCMTCSQRRATIVLPEAMLAEIRVLARAQDRSVSWIVQHAWRLAYPTIKTLKQE